MAAIITDYRQVGLASRLFFLTKMQQAIFSASGDIYKFMAPHCGLNKANPSFKIQISKFRTLNKLRNNFLSIFSAHTLHRERDAKKNSLCQPTYENQSRSWHIHFISSIKTYWLN